MLFREFDTFKTETKFIFFILFILTILSINLMYEKFIDSFDDKIRFKCRNHISSMVFDNNSFAEFIKNADNAAIIKQCIADE